MVDAPGNNTAVSLRDDLISLTNQTSKRNVTARRAANACGMARRQRTRQQRCVAFCSSRLVCVTLCRFSCLWCLFFVPRFLPLIVVCATKHQRKMQHQRRLINDTDRQQTAFASFRNANCADGFVYYEPHSQQLRICQVACLC